ncbi:MAG: sensor histidine kinase [Oscillospiraceae bacterium]|nr:sensor histidine kinase [Oscillospiraceae bacterium]MBR0452033.1 sensor histidine kinase [Oscillospiraceae bacterium]
MIHDPLFVRYLLEALMLIPACIISISPMWRDLRDRSFFSLAAITTVLTSIAVIVSLICVKYHLQSVAVLFPFIPLFFIFFAIIVRKRTMKKAFCFANAIFLCTFCMMYTKYIMAPIEVSNTDPVLAVHSGLVCLGISFLIAIVFYNTVGKELSQMLSEEQLNPLWNWLFFVPFGLAIFIAWLNPKDYNVLLMGRMRAIGLASLPLIPIAALVLYHMLWMLTSRLKENSKLQQENALLKLEEKRYDQLRTLMDQSRALRHDFRQHLLVIAGLARASENDKLVDYISPLLQQVTPSSKQFCLNRTVDSVAAHYDSVAAEQNTTIDWSLNLPSELPIHDSDVCSILGNFLENALKAVKELPVEQRNITAAASMLSDETMGISVKNPFKGEVKFRRNGLPRSTKAGHGIGLQSVSMIAEKYHGSLELSATGGVFSAGVLLYTEHNDDAVI